MLSGVETWKFQYSTNTKYSVPSLEVRQKNLMREESELMEVLVVDGLFPFSHHVASGYLLSQVMSLFHFLFSRISG